MHSVARVKIEGPKYFILYWLLSSITRPVYNQRFFRGIDVGDGEGREAQGAISAPQIPENIFRANIMSNSGILLIFHTCIFGQ